MVDGKQDHINWPWTLITSMSSNRILSFSKEILLNSLKEEFFSDRNFRGLAVFCPFRESLCPRKFSKYVIRDSLCPRNFLNFEIFKFFNCSICVKVVESRAF